MNLNEGLQTQSPEQLRISQPAYKRPLDLVVLLLAHLFPPLLVMWLVLWTLIPLAIWLGDRGPVFYQQKRVGKGGKLFEVLKFRTLVPTADKIVNPWEVPQGPVVTRVGKVLRATALDELPQILNILNGDMSFIGPRAMPVSEYQQFVHSIPELELRHAVQPGLTGLSQVYGKATRDVEEKLKYDLEYIERMSLWLDLKLLVLSVRNTLLARWDRRSGE